jgi:hypothetical protein
VSDGPLDLARAGYSPQTSTLFSLNAAYSRAGVALRQLLGVDPLALKFRSFSTLRTSHIVVLAISHGMTKQGIPNRVAGMTSMTFSILPISSLNYGRCTTYAAIRSPDMCPMGPCRASGRSHFPAPRLNHSTSSVVLPKKSTTHVIDRRVMLAHVPVYI